MGKGALGTEGDIGESGERRLALSRGRNSEGGARGTLHEIITRWCVILRPINRHMMHTVRQLDGLVHCQAPLGT